MPVLDFLVDNTFQVSGNVIQGRNLSIQIINLPVNANATAWSWANRVEPPFVNGVQNWDTATLLQQDMGLGSVNTVVFNPSFSSTDIATRYCTVTVPLSTSVSGFNPGNYFSFIFDLNGNKVQVVFYVSDVDTGGGAGNTVITPMTGKAGYSTIVNSTENGYTYVQSQSGTAFSDSNKPIDNTYLQSIIGSLIPKRRTIIVGPNGDPGYITDGVADEAQINAAFTAASANNYEVRLDNSDFYTSNNGAGRIIPKNNVSVYGLGREVTTIHSNADWCFFNQNNNIENFNLESFKIDCKNVLNRGAVFTNYTSVSSFKDMYFANVNNAWFIQIGVNDGLTAPISNFDNLIEHCVFDHHESSLGMIVHLNDQNLKIRDCEFKNKINGGPIVEFYQKNINTVAENLVFTDNTGFCLYYTLSGYDMTIRDIYATNCGAVLQGANVSDWDPGNDQFGMLRFPNLTIENITAKGGANSLSSTAIQVGATEAFKLNHFHIENYLIGLSVDDGNAPFNRRSSTNFIISNGVIKNGNTINNNHVIHPGMYFYRTGGKLSGKVSNVQIYDDQTSPTQRNPVTFETYAYSDIQFVNCRLNSYLGAPSVARISGATLDSTVKFIYPTDFTPGTLPSSNYVI